LVDRNDFSPSTNQYFQLEFALFHYFSGHCDFRFPNVSMENVASNDEKMIDIKFLAAKNSISCEMIIVRLKFFVPFA
jgi:hypothetical protein